MNTDLVILCLVTGLGTYLFRFLPTRLPLGGGEGQGFWARFFGAIGAAAIATLFVASILPALRGFDAILACTALGSLATIGAYLLRRNVVLATLAGSLAYGLAYQVLVVLPAA